MTTTSVISYELNELQLMTNEELLVQLIARKDLEHPKRPKQLQAAALERAVIAKIEAIESQLRAQNLDHFADQVAQMITVYLEEGDL